MTTQPQVLKQENQQSPKCVTTQNLNTQMEELVVDLLATENQCEWCGSDVNLSTKRRGKHVFCTHECAVSFNNSTRSERTVQSRNERFRRINRDRYLARCDGKYEGPLNQSDTTVDKLIKDPAPTTPKGVDCPCPTLPVKNNKNRDIIRDEQFDARGSGLRHPMPRQRTNFCAVCVEVVVDGSGKVVRSTRGVFLPIDHDCKKRTFGLNNKLIKEEEL